MATSAKAGGAGEPHWLDEKLTKESLKNKVRLDDQDAEQVYQKLNENQIRTVRTLLGFSEESLVNQIGLAPGSAKELRNYVESCKVDETFLKEILCLENSEVQKVNPWLVAKGVSNVGRLLRLQSRDALQELGEGPAAELWGFIEKQKGKLYCSKYYWEYSHTNISDESQLKSQLILVFLKHLMSQLIVSFL